MHFYLGHGTLKDSGLFICRQYIVLRYAVGNLADGVITNAQALHENFAVLIRGEHLLIAAHSGHTEREALHLAVRRCLDDFQAAHLCRIDKAFSGFIFHNHGLAMLGDLKIVSTLIQIEALRRFGFLDQIAAVGQFAHLINTCADLHEGSQLFVLSVQFLVAV